MRKINKKTVIASTASVGAVAALLFGGQAVSTAFTSSSNGYVQGKGASTAVSVDNGNITAEDMLPGDAPKDGGTATVRNNGSTAAELNIQFGHFTVNRNGSNGTPPSATELNICIDGLGCYSAAQLDGLSQDLGPLNSGDSKGFHVTESIANGSGNEWNGADAYLPYTVTLTAGS